METTYINNQGEKTKVQFNNGDTFKAELPFIITHTIKGEDETGLIIVDYVYQGNKGAVYYSKKDIAQKIARKEWIKA